MTYILIAVGVINGGVLIYALTGALITYLDEKQERRRAARAAAERHDEIRTQTNLIGLGTGNVIALPIRTTNKTRPAA